MIAGRDVLMEYTSTKPKEDIVHPASVIRHIVKDQINASGKAGYEHKVRLRLEHYSGNPHLSEKGHLPHVGTQRCVEAGARRP